MTAVMYVLHWIPPYVDGTGTWALQDLDSWQAGEPVTDPAWLLEDEPRDIDANVLADWIAGLVGYPVVIEKDSVRITCPRALRFMKQEPVWWIWPKDVPW